jgi:hypothetical protein
MMLDGPFRVGSWVVPWMFSAQEKRVSVPFEAPIYPEQEKDLGVIHRKYASHEPDFAARNIRRTRHFA